MRKAIIAAMLGLCASMTAQTETSQYKPGVTEQGAVYFLPKTTIRISVLVEKTTYTPGEFCMYANKYLKQMDVVQKQTVKHKVLTMGLTSLGAADKTHAYSVKFNAKTSASNVVLADDGTLLAINTEPYKQEKPNTFTAAPKPEPLNPRKFMSEEILSAANKSKMAELTALEIFEIRESKNLLTRGQADFMPQDGKQLQLMLDNMTLQDKALTQLFCGYETKDTTEHILYITPDKDFKKQVLFRLSQQLGFVDNDDLSGTPYYIDITDLKSLPEPSPMPEQKKNGAVEGIFVNVPGRVKATIYHGNKPMGSFDLSAAQYGYTEFLSGELFNKRYTTKLVLSPITGAIMKLEAEMPK